MRYYLIPIFYLVSTICYGQSEFLEKEIDYLSGQPTIDGILDKELEYLPLREFPLVYKDDAANPDLNISYRLAYGTYFFYVYIEADGNNLTYRDRAYQNGDGFSMVLGLPKPGNQPTDDFYVLACSAVDRESMEWTRKIFWYYNVDNIFLRTSDETKLEFEQKNDKICFELILPWKDVYPYHPWISEGIGFNLGFIKAIENGTRNKYKVLDDIIGAENSKRKYLKLKFQDPVHIGEPQTYLVPDKNNIDENDTISVIAATVSQNKSEEYLIAKLMTGENELLRYKRFSYQCEPGVTRNKFIFKSQHLFSGGYKIDWYSANYNSKGESWFTTIPEFDKGVPDSKVDEVKSKISLSSYHTLKHQITEIEKDLSELKFYESCGKQRLAIADLYLIIDEAQKGNDVIASKRGFVRKAYLSELDESLQPYIVYLPEDYDPGKKYPLFVYLHGSASDEYTFTGRGNIIPEGFIGLGPNGRGPSNCYSWDNSQTDIAEAIDAVTKSYSVDKTNIILAGFSMGGYGVYRTFYETPDKFKSLVVFSGQPNLASSWSGEKNKYPDFTRAEYLKPFRNIPIFIFHGEEDRNCPFGITQNLISNLEKSGAKVTFVTEKDKGHELPEQETILKMKNWIRDIVPGVKH